MKGVNILLISEYVRSLRKQKGLTQIELAEKAGVSLKVIKRFESTRPYNPISSTIAKVRKSLDADVDFMIMECDWGN